ncbi:hypothetical protein ACIB24_00485 [Spongisporangium articulatum]|uniref:DUF4126 domain-containing protein n=1 Tax=Spongisporangium articulatum TaxID=3362603 RepID=A0ABW8AIZ1_9ACTN
MGVLVRSVLLGAASGSRSSLGVTATTLSDGATPGFGRRARRSLVLLATAGELVGDKVSSVSRTEPVGLGPRLGSAAAGGFTLARRRRGGVVAPLLAGAVAAGAAAGGAYAGVAWRRWAAQRVPDWQAAVAEDAAAITLAAVAVRG